MAVIHKYKWQWGFLKQHMTSLYIHLMAWLFFEHNSMKIIFFSTAKTKHFLQRLYASKTTKQFKKLYNLEHISKLQGGQREFEEHASQNWLEVISLVKVLDDAPTKKRSQK